MWINAIVGIVGLYLALGMFFGFGHGPDLAEVIRTKLRESISPDFEIHDWVIASAFFLVGGLAAVSSFMRYARAHDFWVLM